MSDIIKIKDKYIDQLNRGNNLDTVNNIKSELFGKNGIISNEFKKLGSVSAEERKKLASDLNNIKRKFGVIVPAMGAKPIELNVERELHPTNYFTWESFDEVLFDRLSRTQKSINEEGYYKKDRDTGRVIVK